MGFSDVYPYAREPVGAPAGALEPSGEEHLRIGMIAPPAVAVPPPVYGGTESIIDRLARGLTARGHEVVLFTVGDSTCPIERRFTYPTALGTNAGVLSDILQARAAYLALADVDLIHDHTLTGPLLPDVRPDDIPVAATLHSELSAGYVSELRKRAGDISLVAISHDQRRSAPQLNVRAVIHHGIDLTEYPVGQGDGGYLLFLGRMHPDKGVHRAIAVARQSGRRLLIAAKMWEPEERLYFADVVQPMLGNGIEYIGQVGGDEKVSLLTHAEALVNPIRWREPFGLVMIEALACGTPVLSFAEGAATEIVEDGVTGFLCHDVAGMARAVDRLTEIDRSVCRSRCVDRFSMEHMITRHVSLYRRILQRAAVASESELLTEAG
ncbi:glycosyltransferase family 4 protein [Salinibacterium sp. ZJ454]|uniref:glycosyltransferase family 4 protein n=1 Tax=Salinibacterium sp. ZJ454 TaxID=2708339 RepID=UPI001FBB5007|nr:glycosyltransferase family 4 protein [Salinibacterium sp. ZJ454]